MENYSHGLMQIRDIILSFALAFLLPLIFYSISNLIFPEPIFEDFSCEYQNKHCREWDSIIEEYQNQLKELRARVPKSREETTQVQNQIANLSEKLTDIKINVRKTREARDKVLNLAKKQVKTKHLYIALPMGIAALLSGFLIHILPLQIGLILGGVFILYSQDIFSNNWFRLIGLIIALSLIIAIILKYNKKRI